MLLRDFFARQLRARADIRSAEIVRRIDSQHYEVLLLPRRVSIAVAVRNHADRYNAGQRVTLTHASASGNTIGGGYVIEGLASGEQRRIR